MVDNNLKYNFDWETVVRGFWNRFPSKYHPHINNVYTLNTKLIPEEKRLIVHRMYHITYNGPYLIQKCVGSNVDYFILEESHVDLNNRKLSYNAKTIASDFFSFIESGSYESNGNKHSTDFKCSSNVSFTGFGPMNFTLEKLARSKMVEGINQSREFNAMMDSIMSLGV